MSGAAELHANAVVVDCHNDLLMTCVHKDMLGARATFSQRWVPELRAGGVDVQVVPVYAESTNPESSLRASLQLLAAFYREISANADEVAACRSGADIRAAVSAKKIAMVLSLEGASCLGNEPSLVEIFHQLGIRMISFTHMGRSWLADGSRENDTEGRLTSTGIAVLREMERLGILVDISHVGAKSTEHILALATRPVVASHSSSRFLQEHHRNLTDDQARAVAAVGGVIGVNLLPMFTDPSRPSLSRVTDHLEHFLDVAGPAHVGLGPDFIVEIFDDLYPPHASLSSDGFDPRQRIPGLYASRHLPAITEELLRRRLSEDVIRDVLGRNFLRVFDDVMGIPIDVGQGTDREASRVS